MLQVFPTAAVLVNRLREGVFNILVQTSTAHKLIGPTFSYLNGQILPSSHTLYKNGLIQRFYFKTKATHIFKSNCKPQLRRLATCGSINLGLVVLATVSMAAADQTRRS